MQLVGIASVFGQSIPSPSWTFTSPLVRDRYSHTATLLDDGQVLIAGGGGFPCGLILTRPNTCYSTVNATAELYDPISGVWSFVGNLSRRSFHSATLLSNGEVLVIAGVNFGFDIGTSERLNTAELYDPILRSWRPTRGPNTLSGYNFAVRLKNGKVLAVGIQSSRGVAEVYDPATETWLTVGDPQATGPLVLLPDGAVLLVQGPVAELYSPENNTWRQTGSLNVVRGAVTATLLQNGRVLVTGGVPGGSTAAELYDPALGSWTVTGNPNFVHYGATTTLLQNGQVLLAGGNDAIAFRSSSVTEVYDPNVGRWARTTDLLNSRTLHTATTLRDGRVLVTGGMDGDGDVGTRYLTTTELFDLNLPEPTPLSIRPDMVTQTQCFKFVVSNVQNITLDIQYRYESGAVQTILNWPTLDGEGQADICTSSQTPVGKYEFTAIRSVGAAHWIPVSSSIAVTSPAAR
jgi:hypothetical protein